MPDNVSSRSYRAVSLFHANFADKLLRAKERENLIQGGANGETCHKATRASLSFANVKLLYTILSLFGLNPVCFARIMIHAV